VQRTPFHFGTVKSGEVGIIEIESQGCILAYQTLQIYLQQLKTIHHYTLLNATMRYMGCKVTNFFSIKERLFQFFIILLQIR
jgi:hypothetical protein